MITAAASTSILPPDWSTFVPDVLVAILTGVIVGVVVVLYERNLSDRRAAQSVTDAQRRVVEAMQPRMDVQFGYDPLFMKVNDTRVAQIAERVTEVPHGPPAYAVPGYWMLLAVLQQAEAVELAADRLAAVFEDRLGSNGPLLVTARGEVSHMAGGPRFTYRPTANEPPPVLPPDFFNDVAVRLAVEVYVRERRLLDAARTAFLDSDMHWRGEAWKIQLDQFKGAPVPLFPKWWRAWKASGQRRKARAAAEDEALRVMHAVDPSWIPPRPY